MLKEKYGSVALVAGASEGLGAAYAKALAQEGFDLVLVARREEPLKKIADETHQKYGVNVICVPCDLSQPNAMEQLLDKLGSIEIHFLVYNAAMSHIGPFLDLPANNQIEMATTNMVTPLKMVHHFGEKMMTKGKGGIVLMTSLAAFQGSPFIATYAATKSFLLSLAEGLWFEWKANGVDVIGCCAGATATPNYVKSNPTKFKFFQPQVQSPEEVVDECLKKMGKVPSCITGRGNRLASFFMRKIFSKKMAVSIMGNATKKMYGNNW